MRRYQRNLDKFQVEQNLLELLDKMKIVLFPDGVKKINIQKFLYSVQHYERKPDRKSKSGRRAKFTDEFLHNSSIKIKTILQNETDGRISLLRFVSTYLPILTYPPDLKAALTLHRINLAEARILSQINFKSLGEKDKHKAANLREELIESHLKRNATQVELTHRVAEKLGKTSKAEAEAVTARVHSLETRNDELLDFYESDTDHLLWEEIKSLVYLVREIKPDLIGESLLQGIFDDLDSIKLKLLKIKKNQQISV